MTKAGWTLLQRRLHWIVAAIVLLQFVLQKPMRSATDAVARGESIGFIEFLVTTVHSVGGAGIVVLVGVRLVLRRRAPVAVAGGRYGPRTSALIEWNHRFLYVLLLGMALTGALQYYLDIDAARRWHEIGKWLLAAAIGLHAVGALWHYRHSVD